MIKYFILLSFLIAIQCKSGQVVPQQYEGRKIVFGDGGGFSGFINRFYLLDNGYLYKKMHRDTGFTQIATLKTDLTQQLLNQWEQKGFDQLKLNKPGNAYHFIEFFRKGEQQRIVWDPYERGMYEDLNQYFKVLRGIVQKEINNQNK